ncbi:MAG: putative peptidoglycan glycosyltransferase FtsW [Patescibacteria group bacterium]
MGKKYDKVFLGTVFFLLLFGFFALSSASLGLAAQSDKNSYSPIIKQIALGGGVGLILFLLTSKLHYKKWRSISLPLFLFSFFITLLVFEPHLGFEHGGARRWLALGNFTFQPAELLKFSFIVYLCSWLAKNQRTITSFKVGLIPFLVMLGLVGIILVLQPDIGTLGVIGITAVFLFFISGGKFSQLGLILLLSLILCAGLLLTKSYLWSRVEVFLDDSFDTQGAGYQLNQAKIALGSGGVWGQGFGKGLSKFNYLPEPTGDSIFAVIGEEFGFMGTTILIILFLLFFYKCLHIALCAPDIFGRLLASGIGILIIVQSFINMYAIVGLIPLTGLPLIFISQGGSALALTMAEVGILLNISKYKT